MAKAPSPLPTAADGSPTDMERSGSVSSASSSRLSSPSRADGQAAVNRPARKWLRKEKVGQGAQGCVYRCVEVATSREAACKVILLRDLSAAEVEGIKREVATIKRLAHPRLVRYWRATEVPRKRLSIYMEFVAGGSLSGRLRRHGALPLPLVHKLTRQLCEALAFLHARGIAHRDIKCANVFLTSADDEADIKLGDFGALKETGCASLVGGLKGTPHWMAPEVIRGAPPSAPEVAASAEAHAWWFRADVWSLGCAVLEMLTGHAPWRQYSNPHTAMYQIVATDKTPTIPADASDETASFLRRCLQRDPMQRASIAELLAHPFLSGRQELAPRWNAGDSDSEAAAANAAAAAAAVHIASRDGDCSTGSACDGKKSAAQEPESSPTVRSEDEASPLARNGVRKADDCQRRSCEIAKLDSGSDHKAETALTQPRMQRPRDKQRLEKQNTSPGHLRPSRIPRLKVLDPLKKKAQALSTQSPPTSNNDDEEGDQRSKNQSGPPEKSVPQPEPSSNQLPRLIAVDKSSKKREFAIPKHSLAPASITAFTGAPAPQKPAVVARRTARAISPLQKRRAATAPATETSSIGNDSGEMAASPPGDGNGMGRLKLPPLAAARASTASSYR